MSITLQYPSKCVICKEALAAGTEVSWIADEAGSGFSHAHITCPDPTRPGRPTLLFRDSEELFVVRRCSRQGQRWNPTVKWERKHMNICGKETAFPRGYPVPACCPYCEAPWA